MCLCVHDVCGVVAQNICGVFFPLKWVLGLNSGPQACLPRDCEHGLSLCYPEKCEMAVLLLFPVFFLIAHFISEFLTLLLLLSIEMLLKYCLLSFLWNKKDICVIPFPVLNKLSSKWVSSHLNEIFLLWEKVSRGSAEDYRDSQRKWWHHIGWQGKWGTRQSMRRLP